MNNSNLSLLRQQLNKAYARNNALELPVSQSLSSLDQQLPPLLKSMSYSKSPLNISSDPIIQASTPQLYNNNLNSVDYQQWRKDWSQSVIKKTIQNEDHRQQPHSGLEFSRTNFDDYYNEDGRSAGGDSPLPIELSRIRQVVEERKRQREINTLFPSRIELLDQYKSQKSNDFIEQKFPSLKNKLRRFVDGELREKPLESDYIYAPKHAMIIQDGQLRTRNNAIKDYHTEQKGRQDKRSLIEKSLREIELVEIERLKEQQSALAAKDLVRKNEALMNQIHLLRQRLRHVIEPQESPQVPLKMPRNHSKGDQGENMHNSLWR